MKKLILAGLLAFLSLSLKAQTIDTNYVLEKAQKDGLIFIKYKLYNPASYTNSVWSSVTSLPNGGYNVMNLFQAKNHQGKLVKMVYAYNYSANGVLVSVNTDPLEKQVQELKAELQRAEEEKIRIDETRRIQLKALKDQKLN